MQVKNKTTQKREIQAEIENNGWKVLILDNYDFRDWSLETWLIESVWSPTSKKAYVSFLIDPLLYDDKVLEPWAVEISEEKPIYGKVSGEALTISLKQWKNEKKDLVEFLTRIRNK